ncbi:MAG: bifunctional methylenetetrahydrofolate dehydrogenase/methenyltetrahydrofolate cyclohydrolase FolD [bacterium]|nr:bifunctional methylenetetrahydrofolate dehydrogenase/methenyltetrahydrofolate cyclohydrolase FolD [bacterium]
MGAKIISGEEISEEIRKGLREEINRLKERGVVPGLATLLVGEDPASQVYVRSKRRACEKVGIHTEQYTFPATIKEKELLGKISELNERHDINGILVQLPLPPQIDSNRVLLSISPDKDVDGFHPINVGRYMSMKYFDQMIEEELFLPCTPHGIIEILKRTGVELKGAEAVVVGRSNIVGKPVALLLLANNATVTVCHTGTKDLGEVCRRADVLIAAIGRPKFIRGEMVKQGAVVIDVGVNRTEEGLVGDVSFLEVKEKASAITPVPGGVGPMTVTMLLVNTVKAAKRQESGG